MTAYPSYINRILSVGASIFFSNLSLAELAHIIEKTEREIYAALHGKINPKAYRHNLPKERSRVISELQAAWGQVNTMAKPLIENIDHVAANNALARFKKEKVDGYDLFFLESMKKNGILQIITDDGDFSSVSGIKVFTANQRVIAVAQKQNKLVKR
jgi:predicted nucleic acid-binding protein